MLKDIEVWQNHADLEKELQDELNSLNQEQLEDAFGTDLSFGTAGMRALLGVGTNRLNIYTIKKATIGLAKYLLAKYKNQPISVSICYDSRHKSYEFSRICAQVLASFGIKSYLYDDVKPTPLLSYLLRYTNSNAGIMITASHNPKEYNGYKVYNQSGAQLNIQEANEVTKYINEVEDIFIDLAPVDEDLICIVDDEVEQSYLDHLQKISLNQVDKKIKVVFSPEHGTSFEIMPRCFKQYGYDNVICVKEQMQPDGDFPNTKTSNPEEIAAFGLALEYAKNNDADLIIVNDPDADRLGLMYQQDGLYFPLNGNQTGTLLIDYILNNQHDLENKKIYQTIVTGQMGGEIAKQYQVDVVELLTGFKFIGEQIELLANKQDFLFGYEESYGYLVDPIVRDKDAISAGLLIVEMANYYLMQNKTLGQRLEELYKQYGYYAEKTYSITYNQADGMQKIQNAMQNVRNLEIKQINNLDIENKIDYLNDQTGLPQADVIKYFIKDYGWFVLRPSGTEPKLKIYVSVKDKTLQQAQELNQQLYDEICRLLDLD